MKTILKLFLALALVSPLPAQVPPAPGALAVTNPPATVTNGTVTVPTRRPYGTNFNRTLPAGTNSSVPQAVRPATSPVSPVRAAPPALPTTITPQPAGTAPSAPTTSGQTTVGAPVPMTAGKQIIMQAGTNSAAMNRVIKAGTIKFQAMPLDQALDFYSELIGRTILRPTGLPAATITLKTQTDLTAKEAIEALDSVFALNGISTVLVGEKFVTVVPVAQVQQEAAAFSSLEPPFLPEAGQYVTKIVQVTNVRPSEIVAVLQPFAKIPNSIIPIDGNGVLVLRDYAANVKRMMEVLVKIDVALPLEEHLQVIPLRYALASEVSSVLGSLTSAGSITSPTASRSGTTSRTGTRTGTTGTRPTGAQGNFPGANTFNTGGNTFNPGGGAFGGQTPGGAASTFQNRLQQIVNSAASATGGRPLLGDAKIIPDERTNSLLVFGTKEDIAQVKRVVEQLDLVQPQVLIEAIILEVSLDDTRNVGVSAAQVPFAKMPFDSWIKGAGGNNSGNFLSTTNSPISGSQLPSGFSYFGQLGPNYQVAVTALAGNGNVNVLSRPRIQTSHAVEASLFIGDTVPYINGTTSDINGGVRSTYQQTQVGITLTVLPLINPDGLVVMDINQNIEQLGTPTRIDGNDVPTTTKRQASAKVAVKDGETIILGGFISSTRSQSKSGIPYLKDIPLLGGLFRSKQNSNKRVELIVLMRPTVLPTPEIASATATVEREKLMGVKRAEMELRDIENSAAEADRKEIERKLKEKK